MRSAKVQLLCCLFLLLSLILVASLSESSLTTGVHSSYGKVVDLYGSQPKGFTLEGVAQGIEPVRTAEYDKKKNRFVINGKTYYDSPIATEELRSLTEALSKDDRIGVSLMDNMDTIAYGALKKRSSLVEKIIEADKLIGGVVFARKALVGNTRLPGDYEPRVAHQRTIRNVIYCNVTNFIFHRIEESVKDGKETSAHYLLKTSELSFLLIRISGKTARDGGFLPEADPVLAAALQPEDLENLQHIEANKAAYSELPPIAYALRAGEAAAFLRYLRDSKVDLAVLAKAMR